MTPIPIGITGSGAYLPEKILTNEDLEKIVDTSDEWITERTGIKTRRIARDDQPTSDLAVKAGRTALAESGLSPEDIGLLIVATITPDMSCPSTACLVQEKIGLSQAACFDVNAACTGWLYALDIAWQYLKSGTYRNALVIGAEKLSAITDWEDRNTCVLFGDGAGAVILSKTEETGFIRSSYLGANGHWANLLYVPGGGSLHPATHDTVDRRLHFLKMEGREVFKEAVAAMSRSAEIVLERAGLGKDDIHCVIPHQANFRIIKAVAKKLAMPLDRFHVTVGHCGNLSAASIPVALDEAIRAGVLSPGQNVLFTAFGGGFTWGAMIVQL